VDAINDLEPLPLSVLIVDDDPGDVHLLRRILARIEDWAIDVHDCASPDEAVSILADRNVDVVLIDHQLGPSSGMQLLRELAAQDRARASIMVTGHGDEEIAAEAIKAGALDYISKLRISPKVLREAFDAALRRAELRRQVHENREELLSLAYVDELSGLRNRRSFMDWIDNEINRSQRYGTSLWLMMIDLDEFMAINDSAGHVRGDLILRGMGALIQSVLRSTDAAARLGGDEFCIGLTGQPADGVEIFAERLLEGVRTRLGFPNGEARVPTCSIGVASYSPGMRGAEELFEAADRALYASKAAGRDRATIHSDGATAGSRPT
jgi:diguanylate cyclase (GGDEF)-like protein